MKPLTLSKRKETLEELSSSRAEHISKIWQAIAFIEEIRADLKTSRATDPVAIVLTASTQQLQIAAGLLLPRSVAELAPGVTDRVAEDRRLGGARA